MVEEHDKNSVQEFNLSDEYQVRGTPAEIDTLKYFFSQMVPACNPSKNNFCDEKGKKMIGDIFSISDKAFALLVLYNKSHQWKADAKKIQKRGILVKLKTQQLHRPTKCNRTRKRRNPQRRESNIPMPTVVTTRVGLWKNKSCTRIYARKSTTCGKTNVPGRE